MNTEKAIKLLREMQEAWKLQITGDAYDALEMAITALKVQEVAKDTNVLNNDTISRQAAIDIFDDYNVSVENGELEAYGRDRKRLCDLPSVQPETCDTCKHGYFGDEQCNSCRVRFTSHYERRTDE